MRVFLRGDNKSEICVVAKLSLACLSRDFVRFLLLFAIICVPKEFYVRGFLFRNVSWVLSKKVGKLVDFSYLFIFA